MEHSHNRLQNLELMEKLNAPVWLHHNSSIEQLTRSIDMNTNRIKRKIDEVNINRKLSREKEYIKMAKLHNKTYEAIMTAWQIKSSTSLSSQQS